MHLSTSLFWEGLKELWYFITMIATSYCLSVGQPTVQILPFPFLWWSRHLDIIRHNNVPILYLDNKAIHEALKKPWWNAESSRGSKVWPSLLCATTLARLTPTKVFSQKFQWDVFHLQRLSKWCSMLQLYQEISYTPVYRKMLPDADLYAGLEHTSGISDCVTEDVLLLQWWWCLWVPCLLPGLWQWQKLESQPKQHGDAPPGQIVASIPIFFSKL